MRGNLEIYFEVKFCKRGFRGGKTLGERVAENANGG